MDWDREFFMETLREIDNEANSKQDEVKEAVYKANEQRHWDVVRKEYQKNISSNYYKEILEIEQPKSSVQLLNATYAPEELLNQEKQKMNKNRSDIKTTLNKIFELETMEKYLSTKNTIETTFKSKDQYDHSDFGRNFNLETDESFKSDFVQRLYTPKTESMSRLRVNPDLVYLKSKLNEFDDDLVEEEMAKLAEDFKGLRSNETLLGQIAMEQSLRNEDKFAIRDDEYEAHLKHASEKAYLEDPSWHWEKEDLQDKESRDVVHLEKDNDAEWTGVHHEIDYVNPRDANRNADEYAFMKFNRKNYTKDPEKDDVLKPPKKRYDNRKSNDSDKNVREFSQIHSGSKVSNADINFASKYNIYYKNLEAYYKGDISKLKNWKSIIGYHAKMYAKETPLYKYAKVVDRDNKPLITLQDIQEYEDQLHTDQNYVNAIKRYNYVKKDMLKNYKYDQLHN